MKQYVQKCVQVKTVYKISGQEILEMLKLAGKLPNKGQYKICICVPGGGDWSNTEIDIDEENPISIINDQSYYE